MNKIQAVCLYLVLWAVHPVSGQVNTTTANAQQNPSVAVDASGNYIIVWESLAADGDDYGIYGQLFKQGGTKNGSEFKVNTTTTNGQRYPDVAIGDGGDFVVAWMSEGQDGDSWGVYFQRYDASGSTQGSETKANTTTSGIQRFPSIAMDNSENFVITWSQTTSAGVHTIQAQRYNSSGATQGSEFTVNSTTADFHGFPDIALARYSGDFAIVWQSDGVDNSGNGVYGQRYNSSGVAQGSEFRINTEQSGHQQEPAIAMDSSGNFVVVWSSHGQDGSGYGVYGQRYNTSGTAQGSEFRINSTTTSAQLSPSVSMSMQGSFIVGWAGFNSDGTQAQPYVSGYDNSGNAVATESLFTTADNFQIAPSVSVYDESVSVLMAFQQGVKWGSAGDGDDFGIYATEQLPGDILFEALTLSSTSPTPGSTGIDTSVNITATFDENVLSSSISATNFRVWGEFSGLIAGSYSGGGTSTITFNPTSDLFPGEKVTVTLNTSLLTTNSKPLKESHTFSFHANAKAISPSSYDVKTIAKEDGAGGIYPCDLDNDGDLDIIGTVGFASKVIWYQNDGSQNFTANTITSSANGPTTVVATDLDNDSDLDVLYCEVGGGSIAWQKNDGSQSFSSQTIQSSLSTPVDLFPVDLDGDGDMDVIIATTGDSTVSWLQNNGNQSFTKTEIYGAAAGLNGVYAEDIDGDGDMDVLSASYSDDKIRWYENDGFEGFTTHTISSGVNGAFDVFAIDLDSDGDMDVLSASKDDNLVSWYSNNGSQSFTRTTITSSLSNPADVCAVDFDGDGDIDVCAASDGDNRISWCENDGSESFTLHVVASSVDGAAKVFSADINGNGYLDLVSVSTNDSTFAWYESENAFIWQGSTDTVWATSNNWKSGSTPSKDDHVVIPSSLSNYPYLAVNTEVNDLTIESGAELTIKSGITLDVYGDFASETASNIDLGDGLLKFSGNIEQTLRGQITANVQVNNSNNVKLGGESTFKKVVFSNGQIDLGNHSLTHSGIAVGASANSYFKISGTGVLKKDLGSTPDTFHIGFNPYTPVIISCPNCIGSESFELSVVDSFYDDPENEIGITSSNVVTHLWKVTSTVPKKIDITVQWNGSDEGTGLGNTAFLGFWLEGVSNNWADSAGSPMTKSGSDPYTLTRTIRSMNGTYHIGVGNSSSPLPVELIHFDASWAQDRKQVQLTWSTSVEENNSHFEVQRALITDTKQSRSGSAIKWETIGQVQGQGTTFSPTQYSFTDNKLATGNSGLETVFYRLKQVDFSGQYEYSAVRTLNWKPETQDFGIYPNPSSGQAIYLDQDGTYRVLSTAGNVLKPYSQGHTIDISDLHLGTYLIENIEGTTKLYIRN